MEGGRGWRGTLGTLQKPQRPGVTSAASGNINSLSLSPSRKSHSSCDGVSLSVPGFQCPVPGQRCGLELYLPSRKLKNESLKVKNCCYKAARWKSSSPRLHKAARWKSSSPRLNWVQNKVILSSGSVWGPKTKLSVQWVCFGSKNKA